MIDDNFCCTAPKKKSELRRERVITTARKLFIDNGFHATGIAQIAKESGIAVGQLYRDFAAKEDIVAAIVFADCCAFMAADTLRLAIGNHDTALVRDWIHQFFVPDEDPDDSRLFAEIVAEAGRNARIAQIFDTVQSEVRVLMLAALDMLIPGDTVADRREILADTILTVSLGLLHHQLVRPQRDLTALGHTLIGMIDREIDRLAAQTHDQIDPPAPLATRNASGSMP